MLGDLVNVLHQLHGLAEGIGVHILHQERLGSAVGQDEIALIGFIHIANLDHFAAHIGALDPEQPANLFKFVLNIHLRRILSEKGSKYHPMGVASLQAMIFYTISGDLSMNPLK
jgi:hypothetical protein